jgi:hypothetical protein
MYKEAVAASICLEGLRKTTIKSQYNQSPDRDPPNIKNNGHTTLGSVMIVQCCWRYQEILSSSTQVQLFPVTKVRQIVGARWQGNVTMHKLYFVVCHHLCKARWKLNGKYLTLYIRFPHTFLAPTSLSYLLARLISSPPLLQLYSMDCNFNICGRKPTNIAIISYNYKCKRKYVLSSDAWRPFDD